LQWGLVSLAALSLSLSGGASTQAAAATPTVSRCDSECLNNLLSRYLDALVSHDAKRLPWAKSARFSENNVALKIGDGLWQTASGVSRSQGATFIDAHAGSVGYVGVIEEHGHPAYFVLTLKESAGEITEADTIVHRLVVMSSGTPGDNGVRIGPNEDPTKFQLDPMFEDVVPVGLRTNRQTMINLADGYFKTLQMNNGRVFTRFDDSCMRWENGQMTAGQPTPERPKLQGCELQMKLGEFRRITRARDRQYPVIDEAHGVVIAQVFLDHEAVLTEYELTDGRIMNAGHVAPQTWYMFETFKIIKGKIYRISAVMESVPYYMPACCALRHGSPKPPRG